MVNEKISVIIPCYNGATYITETVTSILDQQGVDVEVIIVDDGSIDNSKEIIFSFNDIRIIYLYQDNKGVSSARNKGFTLAKQKYIIFFDADDVMPAIFLKQRIDEFNKNPSLDFVSGEIVKFNEGKIYGEKILKGISQNGADEILLYNPDVVTCPSNYVFKRDFLNKNKLLFNEKLSSTADKFFLLQCIYVGKTIMSGNVERLLYRVSAQSMSSKLTKKLILDNELFYEELIKHELIPNKIKNKSLKKGYYILFASFFKIRAFKKSLFYFYKYVSMCF